MENRFYSEFCRIIYEEKSLINHKFRVEMDIEKLKRVYASYKSCCETSILNARHRKSIRKVNAYKSEVFWIKYEREEIYTLSKQVGERFFMNGNFNN